uniref:Uncharacterized protein n=1 Tax=Plectus sambesii TaxID=2011161 RepID=A0A914UPC7_9BILA
MYHDRICIRKSWLGATEKKIGTRGSVTRSDAVAIDPGAEEIRTRQAVVQKGGRQFNFDSVNSASGCFTPSLLSDRKHRVVKSKDGTKKGEKKKSKQIDKKKKDKSETPTVTEKSTKSVEKQGTEPIIKKTRKSKKVQLQPAF